MIAIALDIFLIGLLLASLFFGVRLNRRLKALRDTQAGFAHAALQLDKSIARAEAALAEVRRTAQDEETGLAGLIEEARAATRRLETALASAKTAAPAAPTAAPAPAIELSDGLALGTLVRAARAEAGVGRDTGRVMPLRRPATAEVHPRSRARIDDDLFAEDFEPLRSAGGRR